MIKAVATRMQKIKVGAFLFACMALLVIFLVLISGIQNYTTMTYYARFKESVTGLDKGGDVRYNGVLVGQVTDIDLGMGGTALVTISIRKDKMSEVREGAVASLAMRGITGIAYIDLSGGGYGKALPEGSYIPTQQSFLSNVVTSSPEVFSNLIDILEKLNDALGEKGEFKRRMNSLFSHIEQSSASVTMFMNEATSDTRAVSAQLNRSLEELNRSIVEIREPLNRLMEDMDRAVLNADGAIQRADAKISRLDVEAIQEDVREMSESVNSASRELEALAKSTRVGMEDVEYDALRSLRQLHQTLEAAETLLRTLEQDPSAVIHGPRPSEERKSARE